MGLFTRVGEHVEGEMTTLSKGLSTYFAAVGLHADVNQYMITQILSRQEPPVAHLALVGLFAGVEEHVKSEVPRAAQRLLAYVAGIHSSCWSPGS